MLTATALILWLESWSLKAESAKVHPPYANQRNRENGHWAIWRIEFKKEKRENIELCSSGKCRKICLGSSISSLAQMMSLWKTWKKLLCAMEAWPISEHNGEERFSPLQVLRFHRDVCPCSTQQFCLPNHLVSSYFVWVSSLVSRIEKMCEKIKRVLGHLGWGKFPSNQGLLGGQHPLTMLGFTSIKSAFWWNMEWLVLTWN